MGNSISRDTTVNFEAEIQEIDNAFSKDFHNPNLVVTEIICNLQREGEGIDRTEQSMGMQELTKASSQVEVMGEWDKGSVFEGFHVGWAEKVVGTKGTKSGKKGGLKKAKGLKEETSGPSNKPNGSQGIRKGGWTRFPHLQKENMVVEAQGCEIGMKRKTKSVDGLQEGREENEKK